MEHTREHISEHQEHQELQNLTKPLGELVMPALICGAVGAVLTIILSLVGRYAGLDQSLKEYYMGEPFYMVDSSGWHHAWDILLVLLLTFGVSFAVLDTDKKWRRVMMILFVSVVVIFSSPVLMLWDVFWSPITVFVGLLWSWICAFIYSCQHTMPCELLLPPKKEKEMSIEPLVISERKPELVEYKEEKVAEEKYQPKVESKVEIAEKSTDPSSCPD